MAGHWAGCYLSRGTLQPRPRLASSWITMPQAGAPSSSPCCPLAFHVFHLDMDFALSFLPFHLLFALWTFVDCFVLSLVQPLQAGFSLTSIRVCYLPFLPSPCLRWFPLPSCPQPLLVTVLPAVCLSPACAYPSLCIPGCSLLCSVTSQFSIVWWCKGTCAAAKHHAIDKDIDMS